jgi:hypothetical protein
MFEFNAVPSFFCDAKRYTTLRPTRLTPWARSYTFAFSTLNGAQLDCGLGSALRSLVRRRSLLLPLSFLSCPTF